MINEKDMKNFNLFIWKEMLNKSVKFVFKSCFEIFKITRQLKVIDIKSLSV